MFFVRNFRNRMPAREKLRNCLTKNKGLVISTFPPGFLAKQMCSRTKNRTFILSGLMTGKAVLKWNFTSFDRKYMHTLVAMVC